jgi:capsule polysaccharide export protein KpsC/LpsZ
MKNIVVVVEDGVIQSVYCPNEGYQVHILDYDDIGIAGEDVSQYYKDVESICDKLVDCTSVI